MKIKLFAIGDIVGQKAVSSLGGALWKLREEYGADFVVANGENAAEGNGLDIASAKSLLFSGTDVLTTGNHVWKKNELHSMLRESEQVLRPANYAKDCPGSGYTVRECAGYRILVMNVQGTTYMDPLDSPFDAVERILDWEKGNYDLSVLDIHAEATGEKMAVARYFDGRISAVFGTHTHVQTADACVLPGGTGYITDAGMTGPEDGILGTKSEIIINRLRTRMPSRFFTAEGETVLHGVLFTLDTDTGHCTDAVSVRSKLT